MADAGNHFTVERRGDLSVVTLNGPKMTVETGAPLYALMQEPGVSKYILDFSNVRLMTSAPIGVLVNFRKRVDVAGGKLRLCALDKDIREILDLTRVSSIFSIDETRQESEKALA